LQLHAPAGVPGLIRQLMQSLYLAGGELSVIEPEAAADIRTHLITGTVISLLKS
jgi:hypothetical protein